jgi:hypothetical protein
MFEFSRFLKAEAIKLKFSGVFWLATAGTLCTNLIMAVIPFNFPIISEYLEMAPLDSWEGWFRFHYLGILPMLLPMFLVILCALALLTENRTKSWKILYALPVPKAVIYLSKLLIIGAVFAFSHLLFMALMVLIPLLIGHSFPTEALPIALLFKLAGGTILSCAGILSLVYLASYFFRSFVFPLALGILGFVIAQLIQDYNLGGLYFPFSWPAMTVDAIFKGEPVADLFLICLVFTAGLLLLGSWLANRDRTKVY